MGGEERLYLVIHRKMMFLKYDITSSSCRQIEWIFGPFNSQIFNALHDRGKNSVPLVRFKNLTLNVNFRKTGKTKKIIQCRDTLNVTKKLT